jgi:hypothetical protein
MISSIALEVMCSTVSTTSCFIILATYPDDVLQVFGACEECSLPKVWGCRHDHN